MNFLQEKLTKYIKEKNKIEGKKIRKEIKKYKLLFGGKK